MTFASLLVVLFCFIGASLASKAFTANFKVVSGQWSKGYFEGVIQYDWDARTFNLQFPQIGVYNELYKFNSPAGYNPTLANGRFFAQYLYKNSQSCSCETSTLQNVMPPFFITDVSDGTTSYHAWVAGATRTVNSKVCTVYTPNTNYATYTLVTEYLETSDAIPCGFTLKDGRSFTLTNIVDAKPDSSIFTPPTGCKCSKPIDVVLSLDRSGSISASEFSVERSFARNMTNAFDFGAQKTNMALLNWNFNRWTQIALLDGISLDKVQSAVDGMACSKANPSPTESCTCCGTPIGGALWDAGREMQTSTRKATKIIILLTDGCQNHYFTPPNTATPCGCATEVQCATVGVCKDDLVTHYNEVVGNIPGIQILVIGVGTDKEICPNQLQLVSGNHPENVWNPQSWDQLSAFVESIAATACSVSENPCTSKCCGICSCGSCLKPLACDAPDDCTEAFIDPVTGCCTTKPKQCPTQPCTDVVCLPKGGCTYTNTTCKAPNVCVNSTCDTRTNNCRNTPNGNPICITVPPECYNDTGCAKIDPRKCFTHVCFNNSCIHTAKTCPSNKCFATECNTSTGNCDLTKTNCDDSNECTIDSCDNTTGCQYTNVKCLASTDLCNIPACDTIQGCVTNRNNCSAYHNTNCTIWSCKNGTCTNVTVCVIVPPNAGSEVPIEAVVGGAVGAAAIAGIVIACVIAAAAAAGGGAYAYGAGGGAGAAPAIGNNPLYAGPNGNTNNPLFKAQ